MSGYVPHEGDGTREEDLDPEAQQMEEILRLHSADNPAMQLVSVPLTSTNFLNWSTGIKRALGAKSKLELLY